MVVVVMMVVVVVVVVVVAGVQVLICGETALTGRRCGHSTPGLTVVAATILSVADFEPVVGEHHAELGAQWGIVRRPVRLEGAETGLWTGRRI
jgi:hypothetical protein